LDVNRFCEGFAHGTSSAQIDQLLEEVKNVAEKLANDIVPAPNAEGNILLQK
jgi:hypothetical protein